MGQWVRLYKSSRWQKLRSYHISQQPLCRMCIERGHVMPAAVVDHIKPHRGDMQLFLDPTNLQSLCKRHHDSDKQRQEATAHLPSYSDDGYPTDGSW